MQLKFPHLSVIAVTISAGLNSTFSIDSHCGQSRLQMLSGVVHLVRFTAQSGNDPSQLYEVLELQAVFVHRGAAELLEEVLQGVFDSETIHQVPFLYLHAMWRWKARFVAGMETTRHLTQTSGGGREAPLRKYLQKVLVLGRSDTWQFCRALWHSDAVLWPSSTGPALQGRGIPPGYSEGAMSLVHYL